MYYSIYVILKDGPQQEFAKFIEYLCQTYHDYDFANATSANFYADWCMWDMDFQESSKLFPNILIELSVSDDEYPFEADGFRIKNGEIEHVDSVELPFTKLVPMNEAEMIEMSKKFTLTYDLFKKRLLSGFDTYCKFYNIENSTTDINEIINILNKESQQ